MAVTTAEATRKREEPSGKRRGVRPCCADVPSVMEEVQRAPLDRQRTLLAALADPTRLEMVHLLSRAGELCVCDFTTAFDLGQPTVSHHLRILREAGIVTCRKAGQWVYCAVDRACLKWLVGSLMDIT